jgi:flagellar biosynthesis/type III secretory pathway M-ring protein FliF/YscJ
MFYIIIFVVVNIFIGLIITFFSGSKYPYRSKSKLSDKFNDYEEVDLINIENSEDEIEHNQISKNDEDLVNELAQQFIPSASDHHDSKKEVALEMQKKIKGYFDDNPKEATKIFKTMLKKDN